MGRVGLQGDAAGDVTSGGSAVVWGLALDFEAPGCFPWVARAVPEPTLAPPRSLCAHVPAAGTKPPCGSESNCLHGKQIVGKFYLMDA